LDLPAALRLLSLPRDLGPHPQTGKPVRAGIGRFGPYVVHDGMFASLKQTDNVLSVELDRALELLALKAAGGARGGGRRPSAAVLRTIGTHPETGEAVELLDGRYGPYVRHGKTNASLPRGLAPEAVDLVRALALLEAKKAKKPGKRRSSGAA
jgi:DNA topoisomerase-1